MPDEFTDGVAKQQHLRFALPGHRFSVWAWGPLGCLLFALGWSCWAVLQHSVSRSSGWNVMQTAVAVPGTWNRTSVLEFRNRTGLRVFGPGKIREAAATVMLLPTNHTFWADLNLRLLKQCEDEIKAFGLCWSDSAAWPISRVDREEGRWSMTTDWRVEHARSNLTWFASPRGGWVRRCSPVRKKDCGCGSIQVTWVRTRKEVRRCWCLIRNFCPCWPAKVRRVRCLASSQASTIESHIGRQACSSRKSSTSSASAIVMTAFSPSGSRKSAWPPCVATGPAAGLDFHPCSLSFPSRRLTRAPLSGLPRACEDLVRRRLALPVPVMGLNRCHAWNRTKSGTGARIEHLHLDNV